MQKYRPKIGLALGSGGAKGYCHIGVLQVLVENGIAIDYISGCSMGALVGGTYAYGADINEIEKVAIETKRSQFTDFDILMGKRLGLMRGNRISKILKHLVPEDAQIEETKIKFVATATDLVSAENISLSRGPLYQAIRASIAVPFIFQPVAYGDMLLVDGGITNRVPIMQTYESGADIVIAVDPFGRCETGVRPTKILGMLERCYHIMDWVHAKYLMQLSDFYIAPNLNNASAFNFNNAKENIDAGRAAAEYVLPDIKKAIDAYKPDKEKLKKHINEMKQQELQQQTIDELQKIRDLKWKHLEEFAKIDD